MNLNVKTMLLAAAALLIAAAAAAEEPVPPRAVVAGIVVDDAGEASAGLAAGFVAAAADLLAPDFEIAIAGGAPAAGDGTLEGVASTLAALYADPEIDMVVAAGYLASLAAARLGDAPIPTIAPLLIDARLHGLPAGDPGAGGRNISLIIAPDALPAAMASFGEISGCRRIALIGPAEMFASPAAASRLAEWSAAAGVEIFAAPADPRPADARAAAELAPGGCDAVMLAPFAIDAELMAGAVAIWSERGLPAYVLGGRADVGLGFLAGSPGEDILARLARRTALHISRILRGEKAADLPTRFAAADPPLLNPRVARELGLDLDRSLLTLYELVGDTAAGPGSLRLSEAMAEAVRANRDLLAEGQTVAAGEAAVAAAKSRLLPHAEIGAAGSMIDSDRAELSFGSIAERRILATASVSQVLFSDAADAGYDIEKNRQRARERSYDRVRLDVAHQAGTAWFGVCRARLLEDVRRRELRLSRRNLELARSRRELGDAGPAEVCRWEADLAVRRNDLEQARSRRRLAEMELNRVLDRPLDAPLDVAGPDGLLAADPFLPILEGTAGLERAQDRLTDSARANSPELKSMQAALAAQRRALSAASRSYYLPTVALQGEYARRLVREGEGSTPTEIVVPGVASLSLGMPDRDDWSVGVVATLPLFEGGARKAARDGARRNIALYEQRLAAADARVAQRARSAVRSAAAAAEGIANARAAAAAADRTLEMVTDAYSRGEAGILDLLDARTTAASAAISRVNAVCDYLIQSLNVQRAAGCFLDLLPGEGRREWIEAFTAAVAGGDAR